jgi:hypothetical protein
MFESKLHTLTDGTDSPMSGEFRKGEVEGFEPEETSGLVNHQAPRQ